MNFGFWNFYPAFNRNRMFDGPVITQGHDWTATTRLLAQRLRSLGHDVATLDTKPIWWFDKIFFIDWPTIWNKYYRQLVVGGHADLNLILCEPPLVRPDNYRPENHAVFRRVLTFKKSLCARDPEKYLHFCLAAMPKPMQRPLPRRKLCCQIQSYMILDRPTELFSERIRAARWFEANAPQDFDLIGDAWDKPLLCGRLSGLNFAIRAAYRRIWPLTEIRIKQFPSYIGANPEGKHETLRKYKFCLCFENSVEEDYISEKLFDCFYAGCVPVYLGAPNVTNYIPAECFIDKWQFDYRALWEHLFAMTNSEYRSHLDAAAAFLASKQSAQFRPEGWVNNFVSQFTGSPLAGSGILGP
jgi:alpha(1,3/1,4) fucosyltransferase